MSPVEIGEMLKARRQFLHLTQEDMEELCSINKKTIQQVEMGKGNPSMETLGKLASTLGMELLVQVKDVENG
jgi:transcriptional regulator with XRE-family HTH domain